VEFGKVLQRAPNIQPLPFSGFEWRQEKLIFHGYIIENNQNEKELKAKLNAFQ
jgi:hypothetical protein